MSEVPAAPSNAITIQVKCIDSSVHSVTIQPLQTVSALKSQLSQARFLRSHPL